MHTLWSIGINIIAFFFETGYYYAAQASFELMILLPQTPEYTPGFFFVE
jgi:hypothetical protein